jgi:hypothetical protein
MQSHIDINIGINVLFSYMNENPQKFDPMDGALENGKPISIDTENKQTKMNPEEIKDFKETMFVSEDGKSNSKNLIVSVEEKAEKQKQNEIKIDNTIQQLNKAYEGNNSRIVQETTPEMEVPKPPEKFDPLEGGSVDGKPLEKKEGYEENHIMNPGMLNKIAQLEAISPDTLEFDQERYDNYMNSQSKLGPYSVGENQKKIQEGLDMGEQISDVPLETIYGQGGWNRYLVNNMDGKVSLSEAKDQSTGSPEYRAKLAQKAKELGL